MRRKTQIDNVTIWERVGFFDDLAMLRQIVPEDRIKVKIGERTWLQMTGQLPPVDRSKNWYWCGYPVELLSDPLDYFGAAISE